MANYLIIGASSGIGKTLSNQLAEAGHLVFGTFNQNKMTPDHPNIKYFNYNALEEDLSLESLPDALTGIIYCPGSINLRPFERIKPADFY